MPVQNSFNNTLQQPPKVTYGSLGALFFKDSNGVLQALAPGTTGQLLTMGATVPGWATGASPTGSAGGDFAGSSFPNPTIANNVVSFAKMQDIPTGTILGRLTANTGDPEALTPAQARTVLGLGTAASLNTGTTNGTIPLIGAGDVLPVSIIPPLRSHEFVQVADQVARLALTAAQVQPGDEAYQQDTLETWKLVGTDPSVAANWIRIADLTLDAAAIVSGILAAERMGAGTPDATKFLRGDRQWVTIPTATPTNIDITANGTLTVNAIHYVSAASQVTLLLPTASAKGDLLEIIGVGAGGYQVSQGTGQRVRFNQDQTTLGATGFFRTDASAPNGVVQLRCTTANTTWQVINANGNFLVQE